MGGAGRKGPARSHRHTGDAGRWPSPGAELFPIAEAPLWYRAGALENFTVKLWHFAHLIKNNPQVFWAVYTQGRWRGASKHHSHVPCSRGAGSSLGFQIGTAKVRAMSRGVGSWLPPRWFCCSSTPWQELPAVLRA